MYETERLFFEAKNELYCKINISINVFSLQIQREQPGTSLPTVRAS